jgi:hypothetical protein
MTNFFDQPEQERPRPNALLPNDFEELRFADDVRERCLSKVVELQKAIEFEAEGKLTFDNLISIAYLQLHPSEFDLNSSTLPSNDDIDLAAAVALAAQLAPTVGMIVPEYVHNGQLSADGKINVDQIGKLEQIQSELSDIADLRLERFKDSQLLDTEGGENEKVKLFRASSRLLPSRQNLVDGYFQLAGGIRDAHFTLRDISELPFFSLIGNLSRDQFRTPEAYEHYNSGRNRSMRVAMMDLSKASRIKALTDYHVNTHTYKVSPWLAMSVDDESAAAFLEGKDSAYLFECDVPKVLTRNIDLIYTDGQHNPLVQSEADKENEIGLLGGLHVNWISKIWTKGADGRKVLLHDLSLMAPDQKIQLLRSLIPESS